MGSEIMCLAVLFLGMITSTASACNDPLTFGYNCGYQCHCAGGQACGTAGSCSNGCASGWEGEYCQRGNVAAGRSSSTSQISTDGSYSSILALDGSTNQSFTRCSHTTNQDQPWWRVDLGKKYVLFTVKIWNGEGDARNVVEERECKTTKRGSEYRGTMSTTRKGFTCADWLDETIHNHFYKPANYYNYCRSPDYGDEEPWCYTTERTEANRWDYCDIPWCQSKLKNFEIFMDNNRCRYSTGIVNFGEVVDIRCDTPVVGQYLTIRLMDSSTVLTLCEVSVQGFLYKECTNKRYGPNCNNQCRCANDAKCNDTTGACPSGCNDHFTGPYCNIGIPTVLKDGPSTPTSISVKWMYNRPHDSAYDAGKVTWLDLMYEDTATSPSPLSVYSPHSPSPGMMKFNMTGLKPSTQYSFHVKLTWHTMSTGTVEANGPTATYQSASCAGYMVMPVIQVTSNRVEKRSPRPNRVSLVIYAQVPGMISDCIKDLEVYVKKTTESEYMTLTKYGQAHTVNNLPAFTEYNIKATVTSTDRYQKDTFINITTAEDVPRAPTIAEAGSSPTSISIRVTPPDPPYGIIRGYSMRIWKAGSSGKMYSLGPTNLTYTFHELNYNTEYYFSVKASTTAGFGAWSNTISITTVEKVPGPPDTLLAQYVTTNSLVLVWTKPKYPNGILTNYKVICTPLFSYNEDVNASRMDYTKDANPGPNETQLMVTGLTPATEYNCTVAAQTSKGYGPSVWLRNCTKPDVPGPPNTLSMEEPTTNSLVLIWTKPKDPNGPLKDYKVICTPLYSYDEDVNAKRGNYAKEGKSRPNETQLMVTGLTPATEYNCSVAAQTSKGYGPSVWLRNWTKAEDAVIPEDLFPSVSSGKTTDSTITIEVPKMPKSLKAGSISKVRIAVEKLEKRRRRSTSGGKEEYGNLTDHATAKAKGYPGYIAAELSTNFAGPFVIGDGKTYEGYYNAPLTKGKMYDVIFGLVFLAGGVSSSIINYIFHCTRCN